MSLEAAVKTSDLAKVQELLDSGVSPNTQDTDGYTALMLASNQGNAEIVQALIAAGANLNLQNTNGDTALNIAMQDEHTGIAQALIAAGANLDLQATNGNTALIYATNVGNVEIIEALIAAGANLNLQNKKGTTALMSAIEQLNNKGVPKLLIESGANLDIQSNRGWTALIISTGMGDTETAQALIAAGAKVDLKDIFGNTALITVSAYGYNEIAQALIAAGADKNIINKEDKTALDVARKYGHINIVNLLKDMNPWKGWTRSDSEKLDVIFDEKAVNYACCPVCLKFVERSEDCMYMKHDCKSLGGFYHSELYTKYKSQEGKIGWCTICGRIAIGHRHYELGYADGPIPKLGPGNGAPYEEDCRTTNGGGGLPEKLARFRRMREFAKLLMRAEEITEEDALTQLVEETWNAPKVRYPGLNQLGVKKEWNFPHTNFPGNIVVANEAVAPAAAREFTRPAPNRNNAALQPIVHPVGMNQVMQDEEAENVIQFRHRKKDGSINNHEETWISQDSLVQTMNWRLANFGDESAISCWEYPKCNALLYPEEIKGLVPDELYERYKIMFNQQMTARQGGQGGQGGGRRRFRKTRKGCRRLQKGGQQEDFFKEATNAECVIVKRIPKGGRRKATYKRRAKGRRITHKRRV